MGDLVRYRLRDRLLGWKTNLLAVELTPVIPASDQIDDPSLSAKPPPKG
jgi:hypothetical protein